MPDYRPPTEELKHLIRNVVGRRLADGVAGAPIDAELADQVIDNAARYVTTYLAPFADRIDREGARFANGRVTLSPPMVAAYCAYCEDGWPALSLPEEHGGQGLSETLQLALAEMVNGACVAFAMMLLTGRAGARVLIAAGDDWLKSIVLPKLVSGEWPATITMTEPQAGSDVGRLTTRAVPIEGSRYALTGTKIFISNGDHDAAEQIVHIALARIAGAPEGTRGLSLFALPKRLIEADGTLGPANALGVQRIEEKLGIHGSPTCVLGMEGAVGHLIGEPGRGLQAMFAMINTMRLEVALQGVAVGEAATELAERYAAERIQGTDAERRPVTIDQHPDVRRNLDLMRVVTNGGRLLVLEIANWLEGEGDRPVLGAWLLPVAKAGCSDAGVTTASIGIQVHGGHGYIRETGAERLLRDARIMPIYEGTNGIQAIDLVTRKLDRFDLFREAITADLEACAGRADLAFLVDPLRARLDRLFATTAQLQTAVTERPAAALAAATPYLSWVFHLSLGWMWLRMTALTTVETGRLDETRRLAAFYVSQLLPMTSACAEQVEAALT